MDARHFKAPYLRCTDIWKQADELRQRLLPQATLPVPVLDLAEFDLGLELAGFTEWDSSGETALGFIANRLCRRFGVSAEVIARRLRIEEFWPPE